MDNELTKADLVLSRLLFRRGLARFKHDMTIRFGLMMVAFVVTASVLRAM